MTATHETLKRVPLFSRLDDKTLSRLEKMSRERTFQAGQDIMTQGDEGSGAFVIIQGRVEVLRDGHKLAEHGPGGFFGEMALLDHYRRSATVRAIEPTTCMVIPRADFVAELKDNNELCFELLVLMSRRVREVEQALTTE
jgi:CRP-like cAMP-binding protein